MDDCLQRKPALESRGLWGDARVPVVSCRSLGVLRSVGVGRSITESPQLWLPSGWLCLLLD